MDHPLSDAQSPRVSAPSIGRTGMSGVEPLITTLPPAASLGSVVKTSNVRNIATAPETWTVQKPGNVSTPTSADYSTWTVAQLRKECTSRKIRVSRHVSAKERVDRLRQYDSLKVSVQKSVADASVSSAPRQSAGCVFRLLNILFSDNFSTRFGKEGGNPSRAQLDAGEVNANSTFWRDVTKQFQCNKADYNRLLSANERFVGAGIDTSVCIPHSSSKLYDMWRALDGKYIKAMARFKKSGEHSDDFFSFCEGRLDVFYLWECLQIKRDLTQFVIGGMRDEDQFDSMKPRKSCKRASEDTGTTSNKKYKMELVECVKALTSHITSPPATLARTSIFDDMLKLHELIHGSEARLTEYDATGRTEHAERETERLVVYRKHLDKLERQLE